MKREEYSFLSADHESEIHAVKWIPDCEPCAVLQIVHGMQEYTERYEEFAGFLCSCGFAVCGHDHIGHGHSVKVLSQLGVMKGRHPSDIMVDDIGTHFTITKKSYPDIPYFILGHSMGSYMLRKFLSVNPGISDGLSGAVLTGTGQVSPFASGFGIVLVELLKHEKGADYRSKMIRSITFSKPYKRFDSDGKDLSRSWLSKNIPNVEKYFHDPYCNYIFSLNGYRALFECVWYDSKQRNVERMRKDIPVLLASGKDDPVGALGKGVEKVFRSFRKAGIKDVTMRLYEGDRHEILNELDRRNVYEDIQRWMNAHVTSEA